MSSYLKRRVALIVAVAIISAQLAACKKLDEVPVKNEAPVATVQQDTAETEPTEETEPEVGGLEWLEENLENLKQSLLDGDYAKVVEQLLEMRDELKDNARYNALLYIAYSGKGDKDKANDLLNNENLNRNEFMDAFLEFTNALKGNAGAKTAEQQLMDAMMHLAQKDKTAYDAAVRVGQNIQNENPSDPNAYVVMYIAALASNDKSAMQDVLDQAKANGISAKVLSTATVEYIERVNVTDVTTEDAKKGIESSTSFNGKGETLGTEVTEKTATGFKKTIMSSDNNTTDLIEYDKSSNVVSATHVNATYKTVYDENGVPRVEATVKETLVTKYQGGKLKSMQVYAPDGTLKSEYVINPKTGEVLEAKDYTADANGRDLTDEEKKSVRFEMKDGRVVSQTLPVYENGKQVGKQTYGLEYFNKYGVPVSSIEYDIDGNIVFSATRTIDYDKNKMGLETERVGVSYVDGQQSATTVIDMQKNTAVITKGNQRYYLTMDENRNPTEVIIYNVDGETETLDKKYVCTSKDGVIVGAELTSYDGDKVTQTAVFDVVDGHYFPKDVYNYVYENGTLKETNRAVYTYDDKWNVTEGTKYVLGEDGTETLAQHVVYSYNEDGTRKTTLTTSYQTDGKTVSGTYEETFDQDVCVKKTQCLYAADGKNIEEKTVQTLVNENITKSEVTKYRDGKAVTCTTKEYNPDGSVYLLKTVGYKSDGETISKAQEAYSADDGSMTVIDMDYSNGVLEKKTTTQFEPGGKVRKGVIEEEYQSSGKLEKVTSTEYRSDGTKVDEVVSEYDSNGVQTKKTSKAFQQDGKTYDKVSVNKYYANGMVSSRDEYSYSETGEQIGYVYKTYAEDGKQNTETEYVLSGGKITKFMSTSFDKNGKKTRVVTTDKVTGEEQYDSYSPEGELLTTAIISGSKQTTIDYVKNTKTVIDNASGLGHVYRITEDGKEILSARYETSIDFDTWQIVEKDTFYGPDGKTVQKVEDYVYLSLKDYSSVPILRKTTEYDESGKASVTEVKVVTNSDGSMSTFDGDKKLADYKVGAESGYTKTTYTYTDGVLSGQTEAKYVDSTRLASEETYTTDGSGNKTLTGKTEYAYGSNGAYQKTETVVGEDGKAKLVTLTEYDNANHPRFTQETDETGAATVKEFFYDESGKCQGYTQSKLDKDGNLLESKTFDQDGNEKDGTELIGEFNEAETEVEQPTEEVEPTEPAQPTEEPEPTNPTDEAEPTDPAQPTEEVETPAEPEQPTEAEKPAETPAASETPAEAPAAPAESESKAEDKAPAASAPAASAPAGDSGSAPAAGTPASSAPASTTPAAPAASAPAASAPASTPAPSAGSAPASAAPASSAPAAAAE